MFKNELSKKIIFYLTFAALGLFWAEVISTNIPHALVNPVAYLIYGLLYVFFIDALLRWKGRQFLLWYIFGVLIGLITETYVAKVSFYGLEPDAHRILGFAPGALIFIIFFYHAFFSFLAPAYLATRLLKMPFPMASCRWKDVACLLSPIILLPIVYSQLLSRSWTVTHLMSSMAISAMILMLWIWLLRSLGPIKNILLCNKERRYLFFITAGFYCLFLFTMTNKVHGHAPTDIPLIPLLTMSGIIAFLLIGARKALSKNKKPVTAIPYFPETINLKLFAGWLLWHLSITAILLSLDSLKSLWISLLGPLAFSGSLIGIGLFIITTGSLLKIFFTKCSSPEIVCKEYDGRCK